MRCFDTGDSFHKYNIDSWLQETQPNPRPTTHAPFSILFLWRGNGIAQERAHEREAVIGSGDSESESVVLQTGGASLLSNVSTVKVTLNVSLSSPLKQNKFYQVHQFSSAFP